TDSLAVLPATTASCTPPFQAACAPLHPHAQAHPAVAAARPGCTSSATIAALALPPRAEQGGAASGVAPASPRPSAGAMGPELPAPRRDSLSLPRSALANIAPSLQQAQNLRVVGQEGHAGRCQR